LYQLHKVLGNNLRESFNPWKDKTWKRDMWRLVTVYKIHQQAWLDAYSNLAAALMSHQRNLHIIVSASEIINYQQAI